MGVTLAKGGNVSLSKAAPNLTQVMIGLGWDARSTTGADFDLDASALLCNSGRVLGDEWFVFYNQLKSPDGSVEHTGDNLTGEGEGDDESLLAHLSLGAERCDKSVGPGPIHMPAESAWRAWVSSLTTCCSSFDCWSCSRFLDVTTSAMPFLTFCSSSIWRWYEYSSVSPGSSALSRSLLIFALMTMDMRPPMPATLGLL